MTAAASIVLPVTGFRIKFHVPGNPVPKQRARVTKHGGYYPERPRGSKRLSYPDYRELVQATAIRAGRGGPPFNQEQLDTRLWGLTVRARLGTGDFDNVAGSIADALQGILWKDDKQVLEGHQYLERVGPKQPRGVDVECWVIEPAAKE